MLIRKDHTDQSHSTFKVVPLITRLDPSIVFLQRGFFILQENKKKWGGKPISQLLDSWLKISESFRTAFYFTEVFFHILANPDVKVLCLWRFLSYNLKADIGRWFIQKLKGFLPKIIPFQVYERGAFREPFWYFWLATSEH